MLGGALEAFEITINYLKEREQFGVKIGSFQALQHRAANMFTELELCKSCILESLSCFEEKSNDVPRIVSLAKAKIGEKYRVWIRWHSKLSKNYQYFWHICQICQIVLNLLLNESSKIQ